MLRFSFLDFFKFNSIRKLKRLLSKFDYDYSVVRWFLDNHYLDYSELSSELVRRSVKVSKEDCSEKISFCLNKFSLEEEFASSNDLFDYVINTCNIIFTSTILLLIVEISLFLSGIYESYRVICFIIFFFFPIVSFNIVKDFYPILSLFRLIPSRSKLANFHYLLSVHFNTLGLIIMMFSSILFLT